MKPKNLNKNSAECRKRKLQRRQSKMKDLYRVAKETAKKYILPLVVAGSLALGSCEDNKPNLPIPDNTKNYRLEKIAKIDSLEKEAKDYLTKGKESLLEGISDGKYTLEEIKRTLYFHDKVENLYERMNEIKDSINLERKDFSLNEKEENLKSKLEKILIGSEYRRAELEKDLMSVGYKVEVETILDSSNDPGLPLSYYLLICLLGGYSGYKLSSKL